MINSIVRPKATNVVVAFPDGDRRNSKSGLI
jgi:hypothetical protein